ncbi:class I SAM-dependent methyltransferase [Dasania sp. GY-MA-18]|uniref:Class I SAM-dependent methyltransferase n=1 Tax=Dasania phycosphaerae TaxID=2950436 RepID=A0A9J6RSA2_9GAMM|nr:MULTISPECIES: class I SAM-dependent methyltransferase [Dasania]MCR8924304.1 class I SAM-dependent methyltransferase [Dasania sp. GY-MA-18]MCZ0866957.1 class I SAM-dependent methyltransferase [Dasania phycosphaerae]MCZ0870461.1 class I SAM-dependent methyltransferase [Dasania phycosphaerae]
MNRVIQAIEQGLASDDNSSANSRRLFHGRGHCYPGLEAINVDFHPGLLLITLYQPLPEDGYQQLLDFINAKLELCVVVQRRYLPKSPSEVIKGEVPEPCYAQTDGMRFALNIAGNQNIGYFLDMQNTHRWLREHAEGLHVLNLFSYTCAFSVAALCGGARSVVNVDMSAGVLKTGQKNHQGNELDSRASRFMKLDILKSWGRIKKPGPYDLLVIDPPSNQRGSFVAEQDYGKVLRRIPQLLGEQGQVLVCLNAPHLASDFLVQLMAQECPDCELQQRFAASADFPESAPNRSLKVMLFNYRRPQ